MPDRTFLRTGSVCLIVGVIGFVVFVSITPVEPSEVFDRPVETLQEMVDEENMWLASHVLALASIGLILVGLGALSHSMRVAQSVEVWRSAAFIAAVMGTTVLIVLAGVDGFGIRGVAVAWADAPAADKATAMRIAQTIEAVNMGLWGVTIGTFFGVAIVLYGVSVSMGDQYPKWHGLVSIVSGLGGIVLGMAISFAGGSMNSTEGFAGLFPFFWITAVWLLVMGVLMWRKTTTAVELEASAGE